MREFLSPEAATLERSSRAAIGRTAIIAALGFAIYGFTVGYWRSPLMGAYVGIKMPLLIACTLGCNGLLNGLLGLLLGSNLGFRQSLHALIGGVALPNQASIALHENLGFRKVAHFEEVGWKFETWIDVAYWELIL